MADLGELILRLRIDDSEYRRGITQARRQAERLDNDLDQPISLGRVDTRQARNSLRQFGANANTVITGAFLQIGASITNILTDALRGIAGIPAQAVGSFVEFEAGLNQLAVVTRQSREELSGVTDVIRQLGIETSKAPTDVIAAANALATLGIAGERLEQALPAVVALSEATATDMELSAELIAKAGTVFGGSFDELADAITTLRNTSAALPEDVTFLLQNAGSVAANVGLEFNELAAAFATARDAGINARPAATGLRNILLNLTPATDSAAAALADLGLTVDLIDDQTGEFAGFPILLQQLQQARQGFIDSGRGVEAFNANLRTLFGAEGLNSLLALLNNLDGAFAKNTQNLNNVAGAASESTEALQTGLAGALILLDGSVDTLLISLGGALAPLLEALARAVTQIANTILANEGLFTPLTEAAQQFLDTLTGSPELIERLAAAFLQLTQAGLDQFANFLMEIAANPDILQQLIVDFIALIEGVRGVVTATGELTRALAAFGAISDGFLRPFREGLFLAIGLLERLIALLNRVSQAALERIGPGTLVGDVISSFTARRHGGPVSPSGGPYLVGEAGPELGMFGGKTALFSKPTILPSPPSGRIVSAKRTKAMLSGGGGQGEIGQLKAELQEIKALLQRQFKPRLGEGF